MIIERSDKEIIIKISSNVDIEGLQEIIDYLKYKETLSKSEASEKDIENLAEEINENWWMENKNKFNL